MTISIIYLYGNGLINFDIVNFSTLLIEKYCLQNISSKDDSKIYLCGESVYEIIYSTNLDYIKIDSSIEIFNDLIFEFVKYLDETYFYSIGFSGDLEDIKSLPVFRNKQELLYFLENLT